MDFRGTQVILFTNIHFGNTDYLTITIHISL